MKPGRARTISSEARSHDGLSPSQQFMAFWLLNHPPEFPRCIMVSCSDFVFRSQTFRRQRVGMPALTFVAIETLPERRGILRIPPIAARKTFGVSFRLFSGRLMSDFHIAISHAKGRQEIGSLQLHVRFAPHLPRLCIRR